jgi:hypothetical protein
MFRRSDKPAGGMRENIDGPVLAAQIRFARQVHKGTILVLEGAGDAKVFGWFIDRSMCEIETGFGKTNVLKALDLLEDEGFPGVIAVVDPDFDRLTGEGYGLEGLCVTDAHDLDLTIFSTLAFERFIAEYANPVRVEHEFK